jgi:hypothetical protein
MQTNCILRYNSLQKITFPCKYKKFLLINVKQIVEIASCVQSATISPPRNSYHRSGILILDYLAPLGKRCLSLVQQGEINHQYHIVGFRTRRNKNDWQTYKAM